MTFLTIGIPVWNSRLEIASSLEAISRAAPQWVGQIDFLVSDNASDDGTWEVISNSDVGQLENVSLYRQVSNIGFRRNIAFLAEKATGEYIWFLGAGETFNPDTLEALIQFLIKVKPQALIIEGEVSPQSRSMEVIPTFSILQAGFPYSETISLNIFERLRAETFLSSPPTEGVGRESWPHLELALDCWRAGSIYKQSSGAPIVSISPNPNGWWFHGERALDIYSDKIDLTKHEPRVTMSADYKRVRSFGAVLFAFEVKLHAVPQKASSWLRFLSALSRPYAFMCLVIFWSPDWAIRSLRNLKNILLR